jgi:hypothetical protein
MTVPIARERRAALDARWAVRHTGHTDQTNTFVQYMARPLPVKRARLRGADLLCARASSWAAVNGGRLGGRRVAGRLRVGNRL